MAPKTPYNTYVRQSFHDSFFNRTLVSFSHKSEKQCYCFPEYIIENRYKIDAIIAIGGFGILLKAIDTKVFNRYVLVKTPVFSRNLLKVRNNKALEDEVKNSSKRTMFEKKMLLHGQLRNISSIPVVIDWGSDISPTVRGPHKDASGKTFFHDNPDLFGSVPYLVLNYFEGRTLLEHMSSPNYLRKPVASLYHMTKSIAETLNLFHKLENFGNKKYQFIYQDLKPSNILGTREGFFVLIDFGSFAFITPGGRPGNIGVHTDGYCAPEFKTDVTPQLDVFSLGMVIKNVWTHMSNVAKNSPKARNKTLKLPEKWIKFIDKCIETDKNKRFKDMQDILVTLKTIPRG